MSHCERDIEAIARYMRLHTPTPLLGRGLFVSLTVLAPYVDREVRVRDLFTRACFLLRACLSITPMVKFLLKAVQATVWGLRKTIPGAAGPCFEGLDSGLPDEDLPLGFSLPQRGEIRQLLAGDGEGGAHPLGVELSTLVSRWASLSVD